MREQRIKPAIMDSGTTPVNRGAVLDGLKKAGPSGILLDVMCVGEQDRVQGRPTMNPQSQFCHNPQGPARGQRSRGNMRGHSRAEQRYRGTTGGQTFAATKDTPFDRLRTAADVVTPVLTGLRHGCPTQAIIAATVHQHVVQQGRVNLPHVQADERWVKRVGRRVWMGMANAIPARLWLGGVISPRRDLVRITTLVYLIRSRARSLAIVVCVDGLASYVPAFLRVFRHPVRTGRRGRPRLVLEPGLYLGQVVKRYVQRRVVRVEQ
jgi:hypothetical protein